VPHNAPRTHQPGATVPGRQKTRHNKSWVRKAAMLARQQGQAYVNCAGVAIPAKYPVSDDILCRSKCRLKYSEKIPVTQRETVLTSLYQLDDNSKNNCIFSGIVAVQPYTMRTEAKRLRQMSFAYYVTVQSVKTRVCKKAFAALHQITNNKIDHIIKQIMEGKSAPQSSSL